MAPAAKRPSRHAQNGNKHNNQSIFNNQAAEINIISRIKVQQRRVDDNEVYLLKGRSAAACWFERRRAGGRRQRRSKTTA
ncbi:hypothetical protein PIB30_042512 [Stylosanthes scabra]|uniref:Uncharacterized protein n=1 Tax=Stylosanthes scabra TaxID=79078 RepID=A0ABU6SF65_9FABA|nr:hypothetical protein [Stylosanthes scabra]